jgi:16S rRNA (guanine966-N2)-methyltransferase
MTGSVRIIAGRFKGRRLPVADIPGLRPTPDRVRETLFNWLSEDIVGSRCLDLFAGSGALGFEAASRGADRVVMVESHPRAVAFLQEQVGRLQAEGVRVVAADALGWLESAGEPFDVVFIDPPFGSVDPGALCARLEARGWLAGGALAYLEAHRGEALELPAGWRVLRRQKAGQVRYYLASPSREAAAT